MRIPKEYLYPPDSVMQKIIGLENRVEILENHIKELDDGLAKLADVLVKAIESSSSSKFP